MIFVLHPLSTFSQGTSINCGVSSDIDFIDYQNALASLPEVASVATSINFEIPIHGVFLHDDGLITDEEVNETIVDLDAAVDNVSQYFNDNYGFYLCSYEVVTVTEDQLALDAEYEAAWQSLYQFGHMDDAVNVYIVNGVTVGNQSQGGVARFPFHPFPNNAIAVTYGIIRQEHEGASLLGHELGHYLGLLHTFNGFPYDPNDPSLPCEDYGDFICDTPADPGVDYCEGNTCDNSVSCVFEFGPFGPWEYYPDRLNLMSYYDCSNQHFSNEQLDLMSLFLFEDPARNFLVDGTNDNECLVFPEREGFIRRVRVNSSNEEEFDPFLGAEVEFYEAGQANYFCDPGTGSDDLFSIINCGIIPSTGDITYGVSKEDSGNENYPYPNGVTTLDLVLINKHILGVELFTSPFQYIAADVNNSGTITTFDVIRIRKLILTLIPEFEEVDSWRFLPAIALTNNAFTTEFYNDPFSAVWSTVDSFSRSYSGGGGQNSYLDFVDVNTTDAIVAHPDIWSFYAIKSGDVNGSAQTSNGFGGEDDTYLLTETHTDADLLNNGLNANELLLASVSVGDNESINLDAYQFSLFFDDYDLELVAIEPGDIGFSSEDFVVDYSGSSGAIKTLWTNFREEPVPITRNEKFFHLVFRAKSNLTHFNNLLSFGGGNAFTDLVISGTEKVSSTTLSVTYKRVDERDFVIKEAYGNPSTSTGSLYIKIDLKEQKDVSILLQDEYGQNVLLDFNNLIIGENEIEIPAATVSFLQNGKIYYTIATDEQIQSGMVIKM